MIMKNLIYKLESKIEKELLLSPLGNIPSLNLQDYEKAIQDEFGLKAIKLSYLSSEFLDLNHLFKGFSEMPFVASFDIAPFKKIAHFVVAKEDLEKLQGALTKDELPYQPEITKGVYQFICIKALRALDKLQLFEGIAPTLINEELPNEACYAIDYLIESPLGGFIGRFLLPVSTEKEIKDHYKEKRQPLLEDPRLASLQCLLSLEIGYQMLSKEELKSLRSGDLVAMHTSSFSLSSMKGSSTLTFKGIPLFRARLNKKTLTLIDDLTQNGKELSMTFGEGEFSDEDDNEPDFDFEQEEAIATEKKEATDHIQIDDLELRLALEIGSLNLSLEKLSSLRPDDQIPFEMSQLVHLTFQGQPVKKGELIELDGKLFFKVVE